jgi:hypothetical protein
LRHGNEDSPVVVFRGNPLILNSLLSSDSEDSEISPGYP